MAVQKVIQQFLRIYLNLVSHVLRFVRPALMMESSMLKIDVYFVRRAIHSNLKTQIIALPLVEMDTSKQALTIYLFVVNAIHHARLVQLQRLSAPLAMNRDHSS